MEDIKKKQYESILASTIVPGNLSPEDEMARYKDITDFVCNNMPQKLYRYRTCSVRNISAFENNEVWFSSGNTMNDDFDAQLYYKSDEIKAWIDSFKTREEEIAPIVDFLHLCEDLAKRATLSPWLQFLYIQLKDMPEDDIWVKSQQTLDHIKNNLDEGLKNVTTIVQKSIKFAAFSERINSDMMWGQYAGNATGFALEYELKGINSSFYYDKCTGAKVNVSINVYPVNYGALRFNATTIAIYLFQILLLMETFRNKGLPIPSFTVHEKCLPCPDLFMGTKIALNKSIDWEHEQEWRAFLIDTNPQNGFSEHVPAYCTPSAVYLGRKIDEDDEKYTRKIADTKKIPVYKMQIDDDSEEYMLRTDRIQ